MNQEREVISNGAKGPEDRGFAGARGWAAWRCPWCGWSNNRDYEGLDACEKCGSESKTYYAPHDEERLVVQWAYEPEKQPNDQAHAPRI